MRRRVGSRHQQSDARANGLQSLAEPSDDRGGASPPAAVGLPRFRRRSNDSGAVQPEIDHQYA